MSGLILLALSVVLTDPMEWTYPDSKVSDFPGFAEVDVPYDGLVETDVLLNDLVPNEPVTFTASAEGGTWYQKLDVPVEWNSGNYYFTEKPGETNIYAVRRAPYRVYDALKPLDPTALTFTPTSTVAALRFSLPAQKVDPASPFVDFTFTQGDSSAAQSLIARVHAVSGREDNPKKAFKYTNWMSYTNMAEYHHLEPWSEAHWAMIEKYIALAETNRQNTIWIQFDTAFDPDPADTNEIRRVLSTNRLERLLAIYNRHGMQWIEGPHLFGRGGDWNCTNLWLTSTWQELGSPETTAELKILCDQLMGFIRAHNLQDRWIQHCMDEPVQSCKAAYYMACGAIRRYMPGIKLMDAIELEGFESAIDIACPKVSIWTEKRKDFDYGWKHCGQIAWVYTCCAPCGKWMNRIMDDEPLRPLYIFATADARGIQGYLHWGYNHWQHEDVFNHSCVTNWGGHANQTLPAGDTHVVYPGTDGPWPSVRLEATRQGMEDCVLYRRLRAVNPKLANEILERTCRGFDDYETDVRKYREAEKALFEALDAARQSQDVSVALPPNARLWGGFGLTEPRSSVAPADFDFQNERAGKTLEELSPSFYHPGLEVPPSNPLEALSKGLFALNGTAPNATLATLFGEAGLFQCRPDAHEYAANPALYALGPAFRLFKGGARILPVSVKLAALEAGAVSNCDGSVSLVLLNRGPSRLVNVQLPFGCEKGFRVYVYDPAAVPMSRFNDLPAMKEAVLPSPDGRLSLDVPEKGIAYLTTDYEDRLPPEVSGVEVDGTRLSWDPVDDPDHAYYRVYRNGEQVCSTIATTCVISDPSSDYEVKSVDHWGNVR